MYSSQIYVTLTDAYGNAKAPSSAKTVTLATSSGTGSFYTDVGDEIGVGAMASATSLSVDAADPNVENDGEQIVYYKDSAAGTHTLTFSHGSYTNTTWTITVAPGVALYDSNDNLVDTFAPTTNTPASETSSSTCSGVSNERDTIKLGDGIYESDTSGLTVDEAITLTSINGSDSTTIRISEGSSNLITLSSRATVSGLHLQGWNPGDTVDYGTSHNYGLYLTASGTAANYGYIKNCKIEGFYTGITVSGNDKDYWKIQDNEFNNCRTGTHSNNASYWTISGNTFTNYFAGAGGTEGVTYYTITNNSFNGINSSAVNAVEDLAAQCGSEGVGIAVNAATLVITKNTSTGNDYGIRIYATATSTLVKYNDITGNASFGIYDDGAYGVTAKYNWWGDATGPSAGTGTYASTAVGSGDAVATGVTYEPWLHKSKTDVVNDNASYQAANMKLVVGWNTLSTPVKLIDTANRIDELIPSGMTIGYYYDATATVPGWQQITDTDPYVLNACDAVYVKMSAETYVYLKFAAGDWTMPSKDLAVGWNLISLASLDTSKDATDAVASVYKTAANLPGYSQVISPSLNAVQTDIYSATETAWSESSGGTDSGETLQPGLGYWIYMQNAATLAGFELTPIIPDFD
jgi:hypothetical protein